MSLTCNTHKGKYIMLQRFVLEHEQNASPEGHGPSFENSIRIDSK